LPATPSRLDALTEIIKQETENEAGTSTIQDQDSGYTSMIRRRGKENSAPGGKRARKALSQAWASQDNSDISFLVETPVCCSDNYSKQITLRSMNTKVINNQFL